MVILRGMNERLKKVFCGNEREKVPNLAFRIMCICIEARHMLFPADKRIDTFGIRNGFTVIDYGCGPGVYLRKVSELVGDKGKVYAVDVHELAMEAVKRKISKYDLANVEPVLARGYGCDLEAHVADVIYAVDMFHMIKKPTPFLRELHRLLKKNGHLIIDDGHQSRQLTKAKIKDSAIWHIDEEHGDRLKCTPIHE